MNCMSIRSIRSINTPTSNVLVLSWAWAPALLLFLWLPNESLKTKGVPHVQAVRRSRRGRCQHARWITTQSQGTGSGTKFPPPPCPWTFASTLLLLLLLVLLLYLLLLCHRFSSCCQLSCCSFCSLLKLSCNCLHRDRCFGHAPLTRNILHLYYLLLNYKFLLKRRLSNMYRYNWTHIIFLYLWYVKFEYCCDLTIFFCYFF